MPLRFFTPWCPHNVLLFINTSNKVQKITHHISLTHCVNYMVYFVSIITSNKINKSAFEADIQLLVIFYFFYFLSHSLPPPAAQAQGSNLSVTLMSCPTAEEEEASDCSQSAINKTVCTVLQPVERCCHCYCLKSLNSDLLTAGHTFQA